METPVPVVTHAAGSRADLRHRLDRATAGLDVPLAVVDLDAFDSNATQVGRLTAGTPVRLATTALRCRDLQRDMLARDELSGLMAATLPEAMWLAGTGLATDILVGYPNVSRSALARLTQDEQLARVITLTVDDSAQLDLVDAVAPPDQRARVRICLDLDCSWRPVRGRRGGGRRSPLHRPDELVRLARTIVERPGFDLVGLVASATGAADGHDAPAAPRMLGWPVRGLRGLSAREIRRRRAAAVDAVRQVADIEFVNAGSTGSLEWNAADPVVTEVTAGAGLLGPSLLDGCSTGEPLPAAFFALPVVRRPAPGTVTVLGGGYPASGPARPDRLPVPWLPEGLRLDPVEGAGELQTPVLGPTADTLAIGDRVWFRHAKAGELCERFDGLHLVRGERMVGMASTYRGEGRTFL